MRPESITKIVLLVSTVLAEFAHASLATQRPFVGLSVSIAVFAGTPLIAKRFPALPLVTLLFSLYLLRGAFFIVFNHYSFFHFLPISAGLLGIIMSRGNWFAWSLPDTWKLPLVAWGLLAAFSWPIVILRELDYNLSSIFATIPYDYPLGKQIGEGQLDSALPDKLSALWIAHAAMLQGLGILWLDWLFHTFYGKPTGHFLRRVLLPLLLSFTVTGVIALYQAFLDQSFMTTSAWISTQRASGALMNANALGTLGALWGPALFAIILSKRFRHSGAVAIFALLMAWFCMLLSGSVSVLLIAASTTVLLLLLPWQKAQMWTQKQRIAAGFASLFTFALLVLLLSVSGVRSPFSRIITGLPVSPEVSADTFVRTLLRDRPYFAGLAIDIASTEPLLGTGIGTFHTRANERAVASGMTHELIHGCRTKCCSLNWYLEQLAEQGLVGILVWAAWITVFLRSVLLKKTAGRDAVTPKILKAALVGFGAASLFNIPAEIPEVLLTFWVLIYWLAAHYEGLKPTISPSVAIHTTQESHARWIAVLVLAAFYSLFAAHPF